MRILLTNDDGIHAPGIRALHDALEGLGEIVTVAPLTVQSATGHGVTFSRALMSREVQVSDAMRGTAISGRPADCVRIALRSIWAARFGPGSAPDLTISGINLGANAGIHVIYSGTVAAALESAFLGVPAIALSLHYGSRKEACWSRAAAIAREVVDRVLSFPVEPHSMININLPRTESADREMPPVRVVDMNPAPDKEAYERRVNPRGEVYYWPAGYGMDFTEIVPGSDVDALVDGSITVTPLSYAMGDQARIPTWRERLER